MSNGEDKVTGTPEGDDAFTRAQWLLDHPEEAERLVGKMLKRNAEEVTRQRIEDTRALYAALCSVAQNTGRLKENQTVDPTHLILTGHDDRTGRNVHFVLHIPPEERDERQDPSRDTPAEGV